MKTKVLALLLISAVYSCSNSVEYSEEFKKETSGKYLYNPDELILVYYENDKLHLNWKGGEIEPVALEENEFFVPDMYNKFHFVQHPDTKDRYLSIISKEDEAKITYDYLKVSDNYKTPSELLKLGNYEKALEGYLKIKAQDSTSSYISEWNFNSMGYRHLRDKDFDKAIAIFKLNAALHPASANVYDSLADGYLQSGDSLQAFKNYKKSLEFNNGNKRAQNFVEIYTPKQN